MRLKKKCILSLIPVHKNESRITCNPDMISIFLFRLKNNIDLQNFPKKNIIEFQVLIIEYIKCYIFGN